jgi:hypothetical protein
MLSLGDRYPNHVFTAPRYLSSSAASLDATRTRAARLQIARSYRVRSEADLLCLCFGSGISPARGLSDFAGRGSLCGINRQWEPKLRLVEAWAHEASFVIRDKGPSSERFTLFCILSYFDLQIRAWTRADILRSFYSLKIQGISSLTTFRFSERRQGGDFVVSVSV